MSHYEDVKAVKNLSQELKSSDEYVCYGLTDDFAWYELSRMSDKLNEVRGMVKNLHDTLKRRSIEQQRYAEYLESKVRMLKELVPQNTKE